MPAELINDTAFFAAIVRAVTRWVKDIKEGKAAWERSSVGTDCIGVGGREIIMGLSNKIWRIVTQPWQGDDGREHVRTELTGPGYYTRCDKGVQERPAVPKPIKGPFTIACNGFCMQLISGDDRLVGSFHLNCGDDANPHHDLLDHEEALWLAQEVQKHLNSLQEAQP